MKDFAILKILDKISFIYKKIGVDYDVLRKIVNTKLIMDSRKTPTVLAQNGKKKRVEGEKEGNQFYKALGMYVLFGVFIAPLMLFNFNMFIKMTLVLGMFMFYITTIFISDFSTIILDVKDRNILASKGVNSRTLNAAKITHIIIYILYLNLALAAIPLVISITNGIGFFLVFLLGIFLIDVMLVVLTTLLYLVILRYFNGEKLKDIINVVQIGLTMTMFLMSQVGSRLFMIMGFLEGYTGSLWNVLVPPMWFAAPLQIIYSGKATPLLIILSLQALIIPIVLLVLYCKKAHTFENYLQKLNDFSGSKEIERSGILRKLGKSMCGKDKQEYAYYNFISNMMSRDRGFKLRAYPMLALGIIMPFVFILNNLGHGESNLTFMQWRESMYETPFVLWCYYSGILIPSMIVSVQYSDNYKAGWIYNITGSINREKVFKAMFMAIIIKFIIPITLALTVFFSIIATVRVIPHIAIIVVVMILVMMLQYLLFKPEMPFTRKFEAADTGKSFGVTVAMFIIVGIIGGIHYFIYKAPMYYSFIYMGFLTLVDWVIWKKFIK